MKVLQSGHVYFFYRPKVEHTDIQRLEDVQRFYMVLRPSKESTYMAIIVGRKRMPQRTPYFAFVDQVTEDSAALLGSLGNYSYETKTHGQRYQPEMRHLAEGKYLLVDHNRHTHLFYQLEKPKNGGKVQHDFHIEEKGDYLVTVRNPGQGARVGLTPEQKAKFPAELQSRFGDQNFIPLNPVDFLKHPGTELLLVGKSSPNIKEKNPELEVCLMAIPGDDLIQKFAELEPPQALAPATEKRWV